MHGMLSTAKLRSNRRGPASWPKKKEPPPIDFGSLARFAYPFKTIENIGDLTARLRSNAGAPRSTVKAWLNGTNAAPGWVVAAVTAEIMRRLAGQ